MVAKGRFAMRPGLTLREDYDAARLRGVARRTKSAAQGRRLLALAEIYDGGSQQGFKWCPLPILQREALTHIGPQRCAEVSGLSDEQCGTACQRSLSDHPGRPF